MKKNRIILAALGLVLLASAAIAQSISVPQVATLNPTADRIQVVPNGQPSAQSVYASPAEINATSQYVKVVPTTNTSAGGYSNTFGNYQTELLIEGPLTMAYSYITFAPRPSDGAKECYFSITAITSLWLAASSGQALNNATTTLAANTRQCYLYSASNATWDRAQ